MIAPFLWILLTGFFAGQIMGKLRIPPLVGMILCGMGLGAQGLNVLPEKFLMASDDLRTIAVMVILAKAGLGLDKEKLIQQGSVALRLGFLPAACEMLVVAIAAPVSPSSGKGPIPRIKSGSKTILQALAIHKARIAREASPVPRKIPFKRNKKVITILEPKIILV